MNKQDATTCRGSSERIRTADDLGILYLKRRSYLAVRGNLFSNNKLIHEASNQKEQSYINLNGKVCSFKVLKLRPTPGH